MRLADRTHHLREQLAKEHASRRRADTIIAQLTQANTALAARVPELEAPREAREAPEASETIEEEPEASVPRSYAPGREEPAEYRSWWRRMFGGN